MWKKMLMLGTSLLIFAAANVQLCCGVMVNGEEQDGLFSPSALVDGEKLARRTADEILRGNAAYPTVEAHYALSFKRATAQAGGLTDAILRSTPGVAVTQGVYVDGERLGAVDADVKLQSALRSFIMNQLPTWAATGAISGRLDVQRQYSRVGIETKVDDMVLLITGMAPVYYFDGESHISRA